VHFNAEPSTRKTKNNNNLGVLSALDTALIRKNAEVSVECFNRRFPEITGEDNLTVFSYSLESEVP